MTGAINKSMMCFSWLVTTVFLISSLSWRGNSSYIFLSLTLVSRGEVDYKFPIQGRAWVIHDNSIPASKSESLPPTAQPRVGKKIWFFHEYHCGKSPAISSEENVLIVETAEFMFIFIIFMLIFHQMYDSHLLIVYSFLPLTFRSLYRRFLFPVFFPLISTFSCHSSPSPSFWSHDPSLPPFLPPFLFQLNSLY